MSGRRFVNSRVCLAGSCKLGIGLWVQSPVADASRGGTVFGRTESRNQDVSWRLIGRGLFRCAVCPLPLGLVSGSRLSAGRDLLGARAGSRGDRWTCVAVHSMIL